MERVMGIEPTPSAWKAEVLPLNYTRNGTRNGGRLKMVEGGGFEPPKAEPSDLQSDPFDRSGTPPNQPSEAEYRTTSWPSTPNGKLIRPGLRLENTQRRFTVDSRKHAFLFLKT